MSEVEEISGRYVVDFARLDPSTAAAMGIAGCAGELTDYSPEGFAARQDLARATLAELSAAPVDGAADRVAARVLAERLEVELALAAAGVLDSDVNILDSPAQRLRTVVEMLDQGAGTDWAAMGRALSAYPGALAGMVESLRRAAGRGQVSAVRQVRLTAAQCEQAASYVAALGARGQECAGGQGGLGEAGRAAARALTDTAEFLTGELAPAAPERDAVGGERYALEVANHLGMSLDLAETYAWGWAELARVRERMRSVAGRMMPGAALPEVYAALDADPAYQVRGGEAFRGHLQELADRAVSELDGVHFDVPAAIRTLECRIPPTDAGGVYYLTPAEDLSRPGQVWWTVPDPDAVIPTWTVPATMYHEGVPGHHLQLGTAVLNPALNRFQRVAAELHPGHCEGWGLYAERVMAELGYYERPAHELGMLAGGQLLRAARVVLDIGLHLELEIPAGAGFHEGERWNRDLGLAFLRSQVPDDDFRTAFEIDRYLGRPGQAIAYKVGERVWLAARERARAREGAGFDLRAFHRRALALGPMGLDLLGAELARG